MMTYCDSGIFLSCRRKEKNPSFREIDDGISLKIFLLAHNRIKYFLYYRCVDKIFEKLCFCLYFHRQYRRSIIFISLYCRRCKLFHLLAVQSLLQWLHLFFGHRSSPLHSIDPAELCIRHTVFPGLIYGYSILCLR